MNQVLVVYSKICIECHDERWVATRTWLMNKGYVIKQRRTALNPIWHTLAKKASGTEDYMPFILYPDKTIRTVKEVEDEKEKETMPKMRRKTTKSARMGSVARSTRKTKKEA